MRTFALTGFTLAAALLISACGSSEPSDTNAFGLSGSQMDSIATNMDLCSTAITSGTAVTAEDIQSCEDSAITLGYDCDDGNDLVIIGKDDTNWALRIGVPAIDLGEDYTFNDAAAACGDPAPLP